MERARPRYAEGELDSSVKVSVIKHRFTSPTGTSQPTDRRLLNKVLGREAPHTVAPRKISPANNYRIVECCGWDLVCRAFAIELSWDQPSGVGGSQWVGTLRSVPSQKHGSVFTVRDVRWGAAGTEEGGGETGWGF